MIPIGERPVRGIRYTLRPGVYAILVYGGRILTTYQVAPRPELQLPGGGIDPGESPLRALHREVLEETGYRISGPRRLGAHRRFVYMPEYEMYAEKLCHVYLARPTLRVGPPAEPDHEAAWMDIAQARESLAIDGDRQFLERLFYS